MSDNFDSLYIFMFDEVNSKLNQNYLMIPEISESNFKRSLQIISNNYNLLCYDTKIKYISCKVGRGCVGNGCNCGGNTILLLGLNIVYEQKISFNHIEDDLTIDLPFPVLLRNKKMSLLERYLESKGE